MISPLTGGALKARINAGEVTYGVFVGGASTIAAEVIAAAGVDWILLDLEHGAGGEEQVRDVVLAAGAYGVPTIVRVETPDRIRIGRVLDAGAAGIMFPRMETADEVRTALGHMQYQPEGTRGVATYNRACRYGLDPEALNRGHELIAVIQIESALAVKNVEEIVQVAGVDALFIGPRDLSHDLGVPGDLSAPKFVEAVARVEQAARNAKIASGTLVPNGQTASAKRQSGQTFIAIGSDTTLLANVVVANLHQATQD